MKYFVLLDCDTVGTLSTDIDPESLIGEVVTVELHDENGRVFTKTGTMVEILTTVGIA